MSEQLTSEQPTNVDSAAVDSMVPTKPDDESEVPTESPTTEPPTITSEAPTDNDEEPAEPEVEPIAELTSLLTEDFEIADGALEGIQTVDDPLHKIGPTLSMIYREYMGTLPKNPIIADLDKVVHDDGTVSIDVVSVDDGAGLEQMLTDLELIGFKVVDVYRHVASGTIPIESLGDVCQCETLEFAMPAVRETEAGSVTSEGVKAMHVDKILENVGYNGSGVTVGVLSDSYNFRGGASNDTKTGDLPPPSRINVIRDDDGSDEGRAMSKCIEMRHVALASYPPTVDLTPISSFVCFITPVQLIHDVAPGANMAFHTANGGQAVFANGIRRLAEEGCKVIVDDIFYFAEPAFQDGIIAQAVNEVRSKYDVAYFASGKSEYIDSSE